MTYQDIAFVGPPLPSADDTDGNYSNSSVALSEQIIDQEAFDDDSPGYLARVTHAIREGASIAGLLRISGAALMVLSLSVFLMQGVEAASDLHRYLLLLGQTLLLSAAGFGVGFWLKEPRGARVFFSLGLISIPANFAVLGAMIYSIAPLDNLLMEYPAYASWQSASINELLIAAAAAVTVLIPMSLFCFAVMARESKWWLTGGYLMASATLLIPLRDTFSIMLISGVCTVTIAMLLAARSKKQQPQNTFESKFATALLFVPPALMLVRSGILYGMDPYLVLAIVVSIHYLLRKLVFSRARSNLLTTLIQLAAAGTSLTIAIVAAEILGRELNFISLHNEFLLGGALWFLINLDLLRFFKGTRLKTAVHIIWAILCSMPVLLELIDFSIFNGRLDVIEVLPVALLVLGGGVVIRSKAIVIIGSVLLLAICIGGGSHLFTFMLGTGWLGMAIAGASTIVAGSVLERFWPVIKLRIATHFVRDVELQS